MSYQYRHAAVLRVIDGDSVELEIDLGNKIRWVGNFRLNGIDAPELRSAGGPASKAYLQALLATPLSRVETFKPDKYGRWLVSLYVPVDGGEMLVNAMMIRDGFAVAYQGGAR